MFWLLLLLLYVGYGIMLKINICARAVFVRAYLFYISMCEFPRTGNDNPAAYTQCASLPIPMKNTSLLVLLGNAKRTPSVEPAERKRARFRAPGGTQVIGLKALIASYR